MSYYIGINKKNKNMKHLRLFPNAQVRDSVLADIDYPVLHSTDGVGLGIRPGGVVPPTPSYSTPFYVENITDEEETLTIAGYDWGGNEPASYLEFPVEYSTDGTTWILFGTTGATPLTRTLRPGDKVYLRATTNTWAWYNNEDIERGCTIFGVSKVGGNIMSLLYGSNFDGNETTFPTGSTRNFYGLFYDMVSDEDNTVLTSASELILPATTLTQGCYMNMFQYCTSLTSTPALPATTLVDSCYSNMFSNCKLLTTAPALPATTLAGWCYESMFGGCTSLTTAPALPATELAEYCYWSMFGFCTSLTTSPALPAPILVTECYKSMFFGCESLNEITIYADDISANNCLHNWVGGVAESGQFHNLGTAEFIKGENGCPVGWTPDQPEYIVEDDAPVAA